MSDNKKTNLREMKTDASGSGFPALILLSLAALVPTFLISTWTAAFGLKLLTFAVITAIYLIGALQIHRRQISRANSHPVENETEAAENPAPEVFSRETEEKLHALEEANRIFSSALKPADMFRLVSNRINEIIPFAAAALYLAGGDRESLRIAYAFGRAAEGLSEIEIDAKIGVAGRAFQAGEIQTDEALALEQSIFPSEALQNLKSAIASPLAFERGIYGVLVLYGAAKSFAGESVVKTLQAISVRIAPLFINSLTFENNLNNALNDSLTALPNERAVFMMLENQVAESQRFRNRRPLTVLSIDIKDFAGLNGKYGHAMGDRILDFAAKHIKEQLRQMDFLARLAGDEFLAVLPTASEATTEMIVKRIGKAFKVSSFAVSKTEKISITLNFGAASFIADGETAQDLMKIARIKKREAKPSIKSSVLWFPKEYSS